jgi:iron complex outermembrane recepter protein
LEQVTNFRDDFVFRMGGRIDVAFTNAESTVEGNSADLETSLGGEFQRRFNTWALFATGEYELTPQVTLTGGVGHAMRPPQLTNLYASGPFLAILQQGFSAVIGNPSLRAERLVQVDAGLDVDTGRFRGKLHGFYGWINDYITVEAVGQNFAPFLKDALAVRYTNTDLVTLFGAEASAEFDFVKTQTAFATLSYVEGQDRSRNGDGAATVFIPGNPVILGLPRGSFSGVPGNAEEPLPGISPLEATVGYRIHEASKKPKWSVEFAARIVDQQDRVATSLLENSSAGFVTYNIRGHWQVNDKWLVASGIENLTNKYYREHLDLRTGAGVFQPGTNFYFSTELKY